MGALEKTRRDLDATKVRLSSTQQTLHERDDHLHVMRQERRKQLEEILEMKSVPLNRCPTVSCQDSLSSPVPSVCPVWSGFLDIRLSNGPSCPDVCSPPLSVFQFFPVHFLFVMTIRMFFLPANPSVCLSICLPVSLYRVHVSKRQCVGIY